MFLRKTERRKTHLYWRVVESKRLAIRGVIQRRVRAFARSRLVPEDRCEAPECDDVIRLWLTGMRCPDRASGALARLRPVA